jgi:hypothetical protein
MAVHYTTSPPPHQINPSQQAPKPAITTTISSSINHLQVNPQLTINLHRGLHNPQSENP